MERSFVIIVVVLTMACSKQDAAEHRHPHEQHAVELASAKCDGTPEMSWLQDMIRKAESEDKHKGVIYAIEYSNGVAFIHQPWLSSCFGCLVYNCEGDKLVLAGSAMDEIIRGATEDNVIYTTTF